MRVAYKKSYNTLQTLFLSLLSLMLVSAVQADVYIRPPLGEQLIGSPSIAIAQQEDTLLDIARRFNVGQTEIVLANPGVDRWMPHQDTRVYLPKRHILPDGAERGVVLNIPEMRMYYFAGADEQGTETIISHPISIGRMDWETPQGKTQIIAKNKNPVWRPPESIKKEHLADGDPLPDVVLAGPDNPLGKYAMRLGVPGYLIHSTNKPYGVGMRVTHGCVRMYPEDIEALFPRIKVGTAVFIMNQPVKVGWQLGTLYIEAHPPLEESSLQYEHLLDLAMVRIKELTRGDNIKLDGYALSTALKEQSGVPVAIGNFIESF